MMDDHCCLNFGGDYWHIIRMDGLRFVLAENSSGEVSFLDLSKVDWKSYCAKAVELLRKRGLKP